MKKPAPTNDGATKHISRSTTLGDCVCFVRCALTTVGQVDNEYVWALKTTERTRDETSEHQIVIKSNNETHHG